MCHMTLVHTRSLQDLHLILTPVVLITCAPEQAHFILKAMAET